MSIVIHPAANVKELCHLMEAGLRAEHPRKHARTHLTPAQDAGLVELMQHSDGGWTFVISEVAIWEEGRKRTERCTLHFRQDVDGYQSRCILIGPAGTVLFTWTTADEGRG